MSIPEKIEIQIIDYSGNPKYLNNLVFGLSIFDDDESSSFSYSIILPDEFGKITLTKEQIFKNTGLKWGENPENGLPTKYEFYIWEGSLTMDFASRLKQLLQIYEDENFLKQDLLNRGVAEDRISLALEGIKVKAEEDKKLYLQIKDAKNHTLKSSQKTINGTWVNSSVQKYNFVVDL